MPSATDLAGSILGGRYVIKRELGTGGMAIVYQAHDVKHDRRVAVKVLRPELSAIVGAERFLHEIRTTANLQHPHILPLHDSGEIDGLIFYVMPFVEGESLRDRLSRDKQLPVDDAVSIAHDAAEALDYAHRHGVIHRDIKPENILLHDGRAMVADFGIALAVSTAGASTRMTETGMSLGTPHYMSPEQAMGEREITARSDVYALGCVLYEMLSGEPPFTGPTAQAIIAKVVTSDPAQLSTLRRTVPPHVAAAVHVALQRLPADRFGSAREFADAISGAHIARMPPFTTPAPAGPLSTATSWRTLLPWGLLAATAAVAVWGWTRAGPEAPPAQVARFELTGDEQLPVIGAGTNVSLSPDGSQLLYRRRTPEGSFFFLRALAELAERQVAGIGSNPRFSPDGRSLVFQFGGGLRKVRLSGGSSVELADSGTRPAWGQSGTIVFERDGTIWSVNEAGGKPERLTTPDSTLDERFHRWADFLPGGSAIVFSIVYDVTENDQLAVMKLSDRRIKRLGVRGTNAHYVAGGYLVYGRYDGTVAAVPFDLKRLEVTGPEIQVLDRLVVRGGGAVELAVAQNGTVVYIEGETADQLVLVDLTGRSQRLTEQRSQYVRPEPSRDGSRIITGIRDPTKASFDVWILDVASKSFRRITSDGHSIGGFWSADGQSLIWFHADSGRLDVRSQRLDGKSGVRNLYSSADDADSAILGVATDPSGQWLLGVTVGSQANQDIVIAAPDSMPLAFRPLLATQASEHDPAVSPDGRRMAYVSNESGIQEVYVTSFPKASTAVRISSGGGRDPVWAPDGATLFYMGRADMLAVRFNAPFSPMTPDTLFTTERFPPVRIGPLTKTFSMMPDGKNFVMTAADQSRRLVVVTSWTEELRQRFAELQRDR